MSARSRTRQFFFRGLAIILPTVLTIWLLMVAYQFVAERIARPINIGVRWTVVRFSSWPPATDTHFDEAFEKLSQQQKEMWSIHEDQLKRDLGDLRVYTPALKISERRKWMRKKPLIVELARRVALERRWQSVKVGQWVVMDVIGLIVAIVLIYIVGVLLSGFIGRRLYHRGEEVIGRVPLIRRVYPAIKQVTDFFVGSGSDATTGFSRVVAVEYPRHGIWSVGLVTGDTMRDIQNRAKADCLTVFIPSSPTPFTGYVISVPQSETIDLQISIEDALKFAVSLGVVVPGTQHILKSGRASEPIESGAAPSEAGDVHHKDHRTVGP